MSAASLDENFTITRFGGAGSPAFPPATADPATHAATSTKAIQWRERGNLMKVGRSCRGRDWGKPGCNAPARGGANPVVATFQMSG